ncbi:D-galactarate dehydratase [Loktanella sp. DJP18]|uniref:D-galactarate dehydratase n=1 Tax=Loktanella sp. DJP18 TaxID=3409788 RepID=UPI003BB535DB
MMFPVFALTACESMMQPVSATAPGAVVTPAAAGAPAATLNPSPPPRPPAAARTVAQFDTTSDADKAQALAVQVDTPVRDLGTTLATLGPPAEPGIWLKTPLVSSLTMGRVGYKGKDANVELRPSGGAEGSGSQISLAAMQTLGIPLTEIAEVSVSVE